MKKARGFGIAIVMVCILVVTITRYTESPPQHIPDALTTAQQTDSLTIEQGYGTPQNVLWHPDGQRLIVQTQAQTSWVYDATTFTPLAEIEGSAKFSDDGQWIITTTVNPYMPSSTQREVQTAFYTADTYTHVTTFDENMKISPDGRWFTIAGALYQQSNPTEPILTEITETRFSPNGTYLTTHYQGAHQVFSLTRGTQPEPLNMQIHPEPHTPRWVWSADEQWLLQVTSEQTQATMWQIGTTSPIWTLPLPHPEGQYIWEFSPDTTMIAQHDYAYPPTATTGTLLHVWDVATGQTVLEYDLIANQQDLPETYLLYGNRYSDWQWSPNSQEIIRMVMSYEIYGGRSPFSLTIPDGEVKIWPEDKVLNSLIVSPDKHYVVCGGSTTCLNAGLNDADTLDRLNPPEQQLHPRSWSIDGRLLNQVPPYAYASDVLRIYDPETQTFTVTFDEITRDADATWSPDGTRIASWNEKIVAVWDSYTGEQIAQTKRHVPYKWAYPHPDAARIAAVDVYGDITIWDTFTGETLPSLASAQFTYEGRHISWQPGGTLLAAYAYDLTDRTQAQIDYDTTIYIFDTATGALVDTVEHAEEIKDMSWAPDGRTLYSISTEFWSWSPASASQRIATQLPSVYIGAKLEISPDSQYVVLTHRTGSHGSETLWLYSVELSALIRSGLQHYSQDQIIWSHGQVRNARENYTSSEEYIMNVQMFYAHYLLVPHTTTADGVPSLNLERIPNSITFPSGVLHANYWSPNGEYIGIQGTTDVRLWQVNQRRIVQRETYPVAEWGGWRPDSTQFALNNDDGVVIINTRDGRIVQTLPGAVDLTWRSNETLVAQVEYPEAATEYFVWDVENEREIIRSEDQALLNWDATHQTWHNLQNGILQVWHLS